MSARIPVVASLPEYRVAVAGLPMRAQAATGRAGAIVVVDGAGAWWDAAAEAVADGARAVLVAEPDRVPPVGVDPLAAESDAPVLVHRSRLRHDLVARVVDARDGAMPRVIVAECRADAADLPSLVRDAVGWIRVLSGGPPEVVAAGGAVLLRPAGTGAPIASLLATPTAAGGSVLRVRALGEVTTELEIDDPLGRRGVSTSTTGGRMVAPALHESGPRAALRRAIDVLAAGESPHDLADLRHDARVASAIFS